MCVIGIDKYCIVKMPCLEVHVETRRRVVILLDLIPAMLSSGRVALAMYACKEDSPER